MKPVGDLDGVQPEMILPQYSDFHYQQDRVAYRMMDALSSSGKRDDHRVPFAMTNQGFLREAVVTLGELAPCFRVGCDPLDAEYMGPYNNTDYNYLEAKARYIKNAVSPNMPWLGIRTYHGYDSVLKEMQPDELRLRVAYLVSRGAKGLFYRMDHWSQLSERRQEEMSDETKAITLELILLRDLLCIAEPADGIGTTSEPMVEAATLLAGNQGMIVYLINHDHSYPWPTEEMRDPRPFWIASKPYPIHVNIALPRGAVVREVYEVGGKWSLPAFEQREDVLYFDVDSLDAARQIVISFAPQADRRIVLAAADDETQILMALGAGAQSVGTAPSSEPVAQWDRTQAFCGTVDPRALPISCRFHCRNLGRSPLTLGLKQVAGPISAQLGVNLVQPGDAGVIDVAIMPEQVLEEKVEASVIVSTNDPQQSTQRLSIGAVVRSEVLLSPVRLTLNSSRPSAELSLHDLRDGQLEVVDMKSTISGLDLRAVCQDTLRVDPTVDVFGGTKHDRLYRITVTASHDLLTQRYRRGQLTVSTNAGIQPDLVVPIELSPERQCTISPSSLLFVSTPNGEAGTRTCRLSSAGELVIGDIVLDTKSLHAIVSTRSVGHEYDLTVTVTGVTHGIHTGNIVVNALLDGEKIAREVPYVLFGAR